MKRTGLRFSVRGTAAVPLSEMAAALEGAMGCAFREGDFQKVPALVADLLGMKISLFEWRGVGGALIFRLHGSVNDIRFMQGGTDGELVPLESINISHAIVDLLNLRAIGAWWVPTAADIEAELDHGDAIAQRF